MEYYTKNENEWSTTISNDTDESQEQWVKEAKYKNSI